MKDANVQYIRVIITGHYYIYRVCCMYVVYHLDIQTHKIFGSLEMYVGQRTPHMQEPRTYAIQKNI